MTDDAKDTRPHYSTTANAEGGGAAVDIKNQHIDIDIDSAWTRVLFGSLSFAAVAYGVSALWPLF